MEMTRENLILAYKEYLNNYLTPALWGEHLGLSEAEAYDLHAFLCRIASNLHPDK